METMSPTWPPGPHGKALWHVPLLARQPLRYFAKQSERYGPISHYAFGKQQVFLILEPDHIRHVLLDHYKNYTRRTYGYAELTRSIGENLLTTDGEFWRRQRRIAQPAFHKQRLALFMQSMAEATKRALSEWRPATVIDVGEAMMRLTLDIVSRTLFGASVNERASSIAEAISDAQIRMASLINLPMSLPTPANLRVRRAAATLDEVATAIIAERRARPDETHHDLLAMLMDARDDETGEAMSDRQLRNEILALFSAGHETTATALTWAFYLLGQHPDERSKLCAEVAAASAEPSALAQLPFVRHVCDEVLRLYPPIWSLARRCEADDKLGVYDVPRDSIVIVNPYLTHRQASLWADPETFWPQRFEEEKRHRFAYLPFGGGPHLCIGNGFALMEMQIILALIHQKFELQPVDSRPIEVWPRLTLSPARRVLMRVFARD